VRYRQLGIVGSALAAAALWRAAKDNVSRLTSHTAQLAFTDSKRLIAEDLTHSHGEKRYYCIGRVGHGVLTVRFTYREGVIRIIGAGYWRRGKRIYEEQS
jgi:uncharacterized DUF497 family protein